MQSGNEKRAEPPIAQSALKAAPPAAVSAAVAAEGAAPRVSPARALQGRLARELAPPVRPWLWHSVGLVLALLLSLSVARIMPGFGL